MTPIMLVMPWVASAAAFLALLAAIAVLAGRSLFGVAAAISAFCACVAGALAALGYGDGALAVALMGAGLAPVLLLGGVVLTGRAARARKRGAPWFSIAAASMLGVAMLWAAPLIESAQAIAPARGGASFMLVALMFVAIAGAVALLGHGERGVLGGRRDS